MFSRMKSWCSCFSVTGLLRKRTRGPWATSLIWRRFLHFFNIILQISHYLHGMALYLTPPPRISSKNLNSIYPRMLCAKFGWNWPSSFKERILKYFQYNFTISLLSPRVEWHVLSFEKNWIPSTQGSSLVEIGPVVLEKKLKMWKVYRRTDRRQTTGDQKSSLEL